MSSPFMESIVDCVSEMVNDVLFLRLLERERHWAASTPAVSPIVVSYVPGRAVMRFCIEDLDRPPNNTRLLGRLQISKMVHERHRCAFRTHPSEPAQHD